MSGALIVTPRITLDEAELEERFVRASGPGGQNVNKVSSAVQLRFDARASQNLPDDVCVRLMRIAGARLTQDGVIVITAQRFRTQERNRQDARDRLAEMIREAATPPKPRHATRPPGASRKQRTDDKVRRGALKAQRRAPRDDG